MTTQLQPTPEAIQARQQQMLEVLTGIKEKAKPEDDNQLIQALAFAIVDTVDYLNDQMLIVEEDRKFMEEVIAHTRRLEAHNIDLMKALNAGPSRDVWGVIKEGSKYVVTRVQDGVVLGTFGQEMADQLVAKLNAPVVAQKAAAEGEEVTALKPAVEEDGA